MMARNPFPALVAGLASVAMAQNARVPDVRVATEYEEAGFGKAVILGACEIDSRQVNCWTPQGEPAPEVAERVKAYYLVNGNNTLQFKFGAKNRFVVIQTTQPSTSRGWSASWRSSSVDYVNQTASLSVPSGTTLTWYGVSTLPETATIDMDLDLSMVRPPSIFLKPQVGAQAKGDLGEFSIVSITPNKPMDPRNPASMRWGNLGYTDQGKTWAIGVGGPGKSGLSYSFELVKGLQERVAVDKSGKPVKVTDAERNLIYQPGSKYRYLYFQPMGYGTPANGTTIVTNVDPKYLSRIMVSGSDTKLVRFEKIRLDPISMR